LFLKPQNKEVEMIYPTAHSVKNQIAKLVYEVRIPANVLSEDVETGKKMLRWNIEREFKVETLSVSKVTGKDMLNLRVVVESAFYFKELLDIVSESILLFENFLYSKSLEYEKRG
jgi:hypothetical protein